MHCGILIRHPEHARFFSPIYHHLVDRGHAVSVYVRNHDNATAVLDANEVTYTQLAPGPESPMELVWGHVGFEARLLRAARRDGIEVLTAIGGLAAEPIALLAGARSVIFVDWERSGVADTSVAWFADRVCLPRFVNSTFGDRSVVYDGYHELAYLHPDRFTPSRHRLADAGFDPDEDYTVVSFVDDGRLSAATMRTVTEHLAKSGTVYLSHESQVPSGFDGLTRVPWSDTLDALAFASGYVGNAVTMATEAALLATPSVVLRHDGSSSPRCDDLESRYGLLVSIPADGSDLTPIAAGFESDRWDHVHRSRDHLLAESVDVVEMATRVLAGEPIAQSAGPQLQR